MRLIDAHYIENGLQMRGIYHGVIAYDTVISVLHDAPTVEPQQWIPVTERLPEANEKDENGFTKAYLVQDARWMDVARWDGEYWVAWGYGTVLKNVVAWMPLPSPFREGGAEECH